MKKQVYPAIERFLEGFFTGMENTGYEPATLCMEFKYYDIEYHGKPAGLHIAYTASGNAEPYMQLGSQTELVKCMCDGVGLEMEKRLSELRREIRAYEKTEREGKRVGTITMETGNTRNSDNSYCFDVTCVRTALKGLPQDYF